MDNNTKSVVENSQLHPMLVYQLLHLGVEDMGPQAHSQT